MKSDLVKGIAAHLSDWECAHVELAIYGHDDPAEIALALEELCNRELATGISKLIFYRSSIGAVAGLALNDGRKVIVKAHQPDWSCERLQHIASLQRTVGETGLAPVVIAGPAPLGQGFANVEAFDTRGDWRNGHDREARRALASSCHAIVDLLASHTERAKLPASMITVPPPDSLWPTPHSRLFDFDATIQGAEYIDQVASRARASMQPAGRMVIGHSDWRTEHVRYSGDRIVLGYDWDSLCKTFEPALVGATAHMFCADWSREDYVQAPTLDEAREFIADYEIAANRGFSKAERRLCGAAFAYAVAYTSRCGHAGGADTREQPGTYHHLLAAHGERLLEM